MAVRLAGAIQPVRLVTHPVDPQPWKADATALASQHDHAAGLFRADCPACRDVDLALGQIARIIAQANVLSATLAEHELRMLRVQEEWHAVRREVTTAVRAFKEFMAEHARCPLCGVLVGEQHVAKAMEKEPRGDEWVCPACAGYLAKWKTTAAIQRALDPKRHHPPRPVPAATA